MAAIPEGTLFMICLRCWCHCLCTNL